MSAFEKLIMIGAFALAAAAGAAGSTQAATVWRKRTARGLPGLAAIAALIVGLLGLAAGPASAAVDLQRPEAGITDPLAKMAPTQRDCLPGQVDLNSATASEIGNRLGIASRPTVARIVEGRPWFRPVDAISVPGVPPSKQATLEAKACAAPPVLPMATPRACITGTRAVDLQSATAAQMTERLKLPKSVSSAIVAARPLPQDLQQVAPPRIPGFSGPKIQRLIEDGDVCVTPAPFVFAKNTWRWISEQHGAVVAVDGKPKFALIAGPRVVSGPTGAWGRVAVLPDTLPRLDAHIYGPWKSEVAVRLPDIAAPLGGRPAVIHDQAVGQSSFSWGGQVVREQAGTVVAALGSLSQSTTVDLSPLCKNGYDDGSLYCSSNSPRDTLLEDIVKNAGGYTGRYVSFAPKPGPCGSAGRARSSGEIAFTMTCNVEDVLDRTATWRFTNVSGTSQLGGLLTSFGTVLRRTPNGNDAYRVSDMRFDGGSYGLVGKAAARALVERTGLLLPSTSIAISKDVGTGPSTFTHGATPSSDFGATWAIFQALDIVDAGFDITGVSDHYQTNLLACFNSVAGSGGSLDFGTVRSCIESQADAYLDGAEASYQAAGDTAKAGKVAGLKTLLRRAGYVLLGEDFASSFIFQAGDAIRGSKQVTLEYLRPAPAAGTGGLAGDGSFIARTSDRKGYLVNPAADTAVEIATGGDFLCYAKSRFVIDLVQSYSDGAASYLNLQDQTRIEPGKAPSCSPPAVAWNYGEPPSGNTPFNVILKGEDDGGVASAWLINSSGQIQTIPDGGTYECLVAANPVIWNVPLAKINAWSNVGTEPARCG